jgi:hypothetical protein
MKFEIDVAGYDMFEDRDYTICIAKEDGSIVKGFKFNKTLVDSLISDWKAGKFRYVYDAIESKRGRLKARIYCIIVYYLFKTIEKEEFISLTLCRDFIGRENEIRQSIKYLLIEKLGFKIGVPQFRKLLPTSYAHIYASMMRRDKKNHLNTYTDISLDDIEKYLFKKVTPRSR